MRFRLQVTHRSLNIPTEVLGDDDAQEVSRETVDDHDADAFVAISLPEADYFIELRGAQGSVMALHGNSTLIDSGASYLAIPHHFWRPDLYDFKLLSGFRGKPRAVNGLFDAQVGFCWMRIGDVASRKKLWPIEHAYKLVTACLLPESPKQDLHGDTSALKPDEKILLGLGTFLGSRMCLHLDSPAKGGVFGTGSTVCMGKLP